MYYVLDILRVALNITYNVNLNF